MTVHVQPALSRPRRDCADQRQQGADLRQDGRDTGGVPRPVRPAAPAAKGVPMSTLVLELRQGDMMVVNGASIRFRSRTRVELVAKARFLFGKQVMSAESANTPARRIYHALQQAYVGVEEARESSLASARDLIADFQEATTSDIARGLLDRALLLAEQDDWFAALKHVRIVMRHEAAVLNLDPATGLKLPPRS